METAIALEPLNRRRLAMLAGAAAFGLAGWSQVSAQQAGDASGMAAPENSDGITVTGNGLAEGDVDRAILQFLVRYGPEAAQSKGGAESYYYGGDLSAPDEDALANMINALVDGGIDRAQIAVAVGSKTLYGMFGPGVSVLAAEVGADLLPDLTSIVENVAAAGRDTELSFDQVGAAFIPADCDSISDAAYLAAVEDGRVQAEAVARALGVELGELTGVTAYAPWSMYGPYSGVGTGSGCAAPIELEDALTTWLSSFVPGADPVYSLTVSVVLTFAFGSEEP